MWMPTVTEDLSTWKEAQVRGLCSVSHIESSVTPGGASKTICWPREAAGSSRKVRDTRTVRRRKAILHSFSKGRKSYGHTHPCKTSPYNGLHQRSTTIKRVCALSIAYYSFHSLRKQNHW